MTKPKILVVALDAQTRATLARWLMSAGYAVELAESARRAQEVAATGGIALAIVAPQGLGDPGEAPRELAGGIERRIVIAAPGDQGSVSGEPGASEIRVTTPLSELDVLGKVRASLLASPPDAQTPALLFRFEGYTLDAGGRTCVDAKGQEVTLTRAEFSLLLAFARQSGRVLSRDELTHVVAGRGAEPEDRSVDVLISRLRRKIEPNPKVPRLIVTMPGEGYKFTAKVETAAAVESKTAAAVSAAEQMTAHAALPAAAKQTAANASNRRMLPLALGAAVVLLVAAVGWSAFSRRTAEQTTQAGTIATAPQLSASAQPASADEKRATVFKRMVAAMQGDRFNWRTVERLAIESGVNETEAHEILAEHPGEVVIGKSRDGKLIARLADH
jgi:two-component system OmpR family response regulator